MIQAGAVQARPAAQPVAPKSPQLESFLAQLEAQRIHFRLGRVRQGFVLVEVAVPGERWEIEFGADGAVEVEVFRSNGTIADAAALGDLLRRFGESQ